VTKQRRVRDNLVALGNGTSFAVPGSTFQVRVLGSLQSSTFAVRGSRFHELRAWNAETSRSSSTLEFDDVVGAARHEEAGEAAGPPVGAASELDPDDLRIPSAAVEDLLRSGPA
jgi:hypothetical protein